MPATIMISKKNPVVLVLAPDHAAPPALFQQHAQQHGQRGADDEVEAPDQGVERVGKPCRQGGDPGGQPPRGEEGRQIYQDYHGKLNGELVDGVGDGDLILALEEVHVRPLFGDRRPGAADLPPADKQVQNDDAHDAGHKIARRRDGKAEAAAAGKAQRLIAGADVVRLPRSLAVAHGEQEPRSPEQAGHDRAAQKDGDQQAGDALHQIRAHDDGAGLEPGHVAGPLFLFRRDAQAHGDKPESDAVVHQDLHHGLIQPDNADIFRDQQQEPGKNSDGHQAFSDEAELLAHHVRDQDGGGHQAELGDDVPERMVGG